MLVVLAMEASVTGTTPILSGVPWWIMKQGQWMVFSERELTFPFAVCYRHSSIVCLSSVTFVRPTQAVQIFGNISMALGTLAIR